MSTPIVILVGQGRSGKDTAGEAIARELGGLCVALADPIKRFCAPVFEMSPDQLWGKTKEVEFTRAVPWVEDCWKALSEALHGWKTPAELSRLNFERWLLTLPKQTTPRHIMQSFGTECVRDMWPDFWIDHGLWVSNKLLVGGYGYDREAGLVLASVRADIVCLTDGRFRNEVLSVKQVGGIALEIVRPTAQDGFSDAAKLHRSETENRTIPRWWFDATITNDGTLGQFQGAAVGMAQLILGAR